MLAGMFGIRSWSQSRYPFADRLGQDIAIKERLLMKLGQTAQWEWAAGSCSIRYRLKLKEHIGAGLRLTATLAH
jgi:hypothetical protein